MRKIEMVDVVVAEDHVRVIVVLDKTAGIRQFKGEDKTKANAIARTLAYAEDRVHPAGVLHVGYKCLREDLDDDERIAGGIDRGTIGNRNIGELRGVDAYRKFDATFLTGRGTGGPLSVERTAAALMERWPKVTIEDNAWFPQKKQLNRVRSGGSLRSLQDYHPDPMCERVRHAQTIEEQRQNGRRGRLVERTADNPHVVYIGTRCFAQDWVLDQGVTFEQLYPSHPLRVIARDHGVIRAAPKLVCPRFRAMFDDVQKRGHEQKVAAKNQNLRNRSLKRVKKQTEDFDFSEFSQFMIGQNGERVLGPSHINGTHLYDWGLKTGPGTGVSDLAPLPFERINDTSTVFCAPPTIPSVVDYVFAPYVEIQARYPSGGSGPAMKVFVDVWRYPTKAGRNELVQWLAAEPVDVIDQWPDYEW